jgi:predicted aldo/keto reductase-like oxidoreductase
MFYTSLERTGAGYFDFYLLHNLGEARTGFFDRFDIWDFLAQRKQEGLIRHLGFSLHDKADVLDEVLTEHPEMEFVQLQINYADWDNPRIESKQCYETVRKHGKPVIVMEPVKGGLLASPPPAVGSILTDANPDASLPSWAIRFAASLDGIVTVLSGMSNIEQLKDNISFMQDFEPLNKEERETISRAQSVINTIGTIPCTSCEYCMAGCSQSIAIPGIFGAMNTLTIYKDEQAAKGSYFWSTKAMHFGGASDCIECGHCESVCPQHISIIEGLKKAAAALE